MTSTRFRRRARSLAGLAILFLLAASGTAAAHIPTHGIGTLSRLLFTRDRILITFDLGYDGFWAQGEMLTLDADKDTAIQAAEADPYLRRQWEVKVAPRLRARLDGREVPLRKVSERHENLVGEIYGVPFSLFYELEVDMPAGGAQPGKTYTFELEDTVVEDETPAKPQFFIPFERHWSGVGGELRFNPQFIEPEEAFISLDFAIGTEGHLRVGKRLVLRLSFDPTGAGPAVAKAAESDAAIAGRAPASAAASSDPLTAGPESAENLTWLEIVFWIAVCLAYGAGHALTPGHGKSMVAAYLIGTRGRVRDAVILGLTTTVTHTGSVFLFGAVIVLVINAGTRFSEGALKNMVLVGTSLMSGVLLMVLGLALFYRRRRALIAGESFLHSHHHEHAPESPGDSDRTPPGGVGHHHHERFEPGHHHSHSHGHSHGHGHGHGHTHGHGHGHSHSPGQSQPVGLLQGGVPRLRDLIALGISGGLVPCPGGLTVILISLNQPEHFLFALARLLAFSIGLGAVLVSIGVLLITGKAMAAARSKDGAFFQEIQFLRKVFPLSFLALLDRAGRRFLELAPVLSSLFIALLGAFFVTRAFQTGRTEIRAMLRGLADLL